MQIILRRELTAHYSFSRDRIETCLQRISLSLTLHSNCVNIISHLNLTTRLCGCLWRRLGLEIIVSENKLIIKILTRVSSTVGLTWSLENSFCPTACWRLFLWNTTRKAFFKRQSSGRMSHILELNLCLLLTVRLLRRSIWCGAGN